MEERIQVLEVTVAKQEKLIESLLKTVDLLDKRIDVSNNKIDLVKQLATANAEMIQVNNDTWTSLFEFFKKD